MTVKSITCLAICGVGCGAGSRKAQPLLLPGLTVVGARQCWIGYIDMAAHMLDAMLGEHANSGVGALFGVFVGDGGFTLGPALDAFEQGAAEVPLGLACGQGRIQMNMRLYKWRDQQLAPGVGITVLHRHGAWLQGDCADAFAFVGHGVQARGFAQCGVDNVHIRSCR